jgi:hypothetical protein
MKYIRKTDGCNIAEHRNKHGGHVERMEENRISSKIKDV